MGLTDSVERSQIHPFRGGVSSRVRWLMRVTIGHVKTTNLHTENEHQVVVVLPTEKKKEANKTKTDKQLAKRFKKALGKIHAALKDNPGMEVKVYPK